MSTLSGTSAQAAASDGVQLLGALPPATVSLHYRADIVEGGTLPYHVKVTSGAVPPGLILHPKRGYISGWPTAAGNYTFELEVSDPPNLDVIAQSYSILVNVGTGGGPVSVNVSPSSATLSSGQRQQFTAIVSGTSNTGVTWSATSGSITSLGLFTAQTVSAPTSITVTATSVADPTKSASATVAAVPSTTQALAISTSNLPQGEQGNSYSEAFTATGGVPPYSWSISSGTTPPGITMSANGTLVGLPTAAGTYNFAVTVTDSTSATATGNFAVTVNAASSSGGSNFDGPAELPRVTVSSAMADTPAPGSVISVNAGGDLQAALNSATCGQTIQLQAGATFNGQFNVPAKNCDINHWIIIRTSAPDSALPAEGQRATPCYAGVASLVGRPAYSCADPVNVMAKVQMVAQGDGPFELVSGANYYRFVGLEIARSAAKSARLVTAQGTADHIIIDRSWLHGLPQGETQDGIQLDGMTNVAIVDSYFSDFHCISGTGSCTDAHAISGGTSTTQDGPYKIQDNFLEASGEAILFGGGPATTSPSDIQVLNNHFWKPWQWMPGNPNFVGAPDGHPFIVKNHFELKNAVRVLVDSNLMENNWGGFSQTGYGILLTPLNQATDEGLGPFVCPLCQVTDITIRYTHVSHVGGGIQMGAAEDTPHGPGQPALAGERWSIHDIVIDDISKQYVGEGTGFSIGSMWTKNALNTITINHTTVFPDPTSHMMTLGSKQGRAQMYGFVFTNNLIVTGRYPVWDAIGGTGSCAHDDVPKTSVANCFGTYIFNTNALIASPTAFPPSLWPANNLFSQTIDDVSFVTFNEGNGGNYELQPGSPFKNRGTDGKDLGADIVGLNAALANVE